MAKKYSSPTAYGLVRSAQACGKVIKELERTAAKFKRAADKEQENRRAELDMVLDFTLQDLEDLYDYASISRKTFDRFRTLLEEGEDALENPVPSLNDLSLKIVNSIIRDLREEQHEAELAALPPEQQAAELAKAEAARLAWDKKIASIKERMGRT